MAIKLDSRYIIIFIICGTILYFLFSSSGSNQNDDIKSATTDAIAYRNNSSTLSMNDFLMNEVERLRNALSLADDKMSKDIIRIKELSNELELLNSSKELLYAQIASKIEEKEIFPSIIHIEMPYSYSVNRTNISHHNRWWNNDFKTGWGNSIFNAFKKYLTSNTVHIDFGAWIGPTVLFAANIAKRVIAFECDPYAERELIANIRVNPYLSHKISVSSLCISDRIHSTKMAGEGGSGSVINTVGQEHFGKIKQITNRIWTVHCIPLFNILEEQKLLDGSNDLFIKIDTEGAEAIILPTFYQWLVELDSKTKPTILVSMHSQFSKLSQTPEAIKGILKTFSAFKYATPLGESIKKESNSWNETYLVSHCETCDIILTDKEY